MAYIDARQSVKPPGFEVARQIGDFLSRLPRPEDFGGNDAASIERAANYAASNTGVLEFDGIYPVTRNIDLPSGVRYVASRRTRLDGSARADSVNNGYTSGTLAIIPGTRGGAVSLDADIQPVSGCSAKTITHSAGVATFETYEPHGYSTGDLVWNLYAGGYSSLPSGGLYFLSQAASDEMMPLTTPFEVTVTDPTHFTFVVDPAAPSSLAVSSIYSTRNHLLVSTVSAHGCAIGDTIEITSNAAVPVLTGSQTINYAEKLTVARVLSSTQLVVAAAPRVAYLVSDSASVRKLNMGGATEIDGFNIVGRGSTETVTKGDGDTGINADLLSHIGIRNTRVHNCENFSFNVQRCGSAVFDACAATASFTDDAGRVSGIVKYPYAFNYGGHIESVIFRDTYIRGNFRHGIVEATDGSNPGYSQQVIIENPDIRGTVSNCIATHYPNEGYTVRGGYLSGNEYGIDARAGDLTVDGVRGSGGYGLVIASGSAENIDIRNVRGDNYLREMIFIKPSGDVNALPTARVGIADVFARNVRRAVYYLAPSGGLRARSVSVERVYSDKTEFDAIRVDFDASNGGDITIDAVTGLDVQRGAVTKTVVFVNNASAGSIDNVGGSCTTGTLVPITMSNSAGVWRGKKTFGAQNVVPPLTISSGAITIPYRGNHMFRIIGEGATADDLDAILGLNAEQEITLIRNSSPITIRDSSTSGVASSSGAIQTPGNTSIVLDSSFKFVTIKGANIGGSDVYPIVSISRADA